MLPQPQVWWNFSRRKQCSYLHCAAIHIALVTLPAVVRSANLGNGEWTAFNLKCHMWHMDCRTAQLEVLLSSPIHNRQKVPPKRLEKCQKLHSTRLCEIFRDWVNFSKHPPSGPMFSISRNVRLSVCPSVCPSVLLSVCSLLRYH